jgi:hypothetical protein
MTSAKGVASILITLGKYKDDNIYQKFDCKVDGAQLLVHWNGQESGRDDHWNIKIVKKDATGTQEEKTEYDIRYTRMEEKIEEPTDDCCCLEYGPCYCKK